MATSETVACRFFAFPVSVLWPFRTGYTRTTKIKNETMWWGEWDRAGGWVVGRLERELIFENEAYCLFCCRICSLLSKVTWIVAAALRTRKIIMGDSTRTTTRMAIPMAVLLLALRMFMVISALEQNEMN